MLLGPNGQNIYPEEIEDKLNSMTMVVESLVVQRDNKLVALVYPDYDEAKNMKFSADDIRNIMDQNLNGLNDMIPAYEKVAEIEIREEEFEKTPKRSIKRYLYK
jgi:long-chain acyl-CoA synthetase